MPYTNSPSTVPPLTYNAQSGDYTFVLADDYNFSVVTELTGSDPHSFSIPLHANVAFPVGTVLYVSQSGSGALTVIGVGGVTIRSAGAVPAAPIVRAQYCMVACFQRSLDIWQIVGEVT